MLKHLKKYWFFCLLAPLFMVGETFADLHQPELMAAIVDHGVLEQNLPLILSNGIEMIITVLLGGLSGILCGVFANLAAQQFSNDLRKELFGKIMSLSFEQTDYFSTGSLVTRLGNDVSQIERMVMMSVRGVFRSGILFVGGIVMLYRQAARFSLIALCAFPLVVLVVAYFLVKTSPLFTKVQKKLDGINAIMQETIAGARVVKAYVREDHELGRFDDANEDLCATNLRVQSLLAFMMPLMNIILNICVVTVLLIGGYSVRTGSGVTPGQIMAAITYMTTILNSILFLSNIFQTFVRASASVTRVNEVLRCDVTIRDGQLPAPETLHGDIEFRNVRFAYPGAGAGDVLENVSLHIRPGETFAIIGATGSGKSSLVHLIPRFYDATEGEVLLNGQNVRDYKLEDLRSKIAIVLQKAELYSRSVEANIRWSRPDADPWQIKTAAEIAQADEFICSTPAGYYTAVTEGGHSLSGGQKQRICIARAVLKNAEVLIFDDSSSALDLKTEANLYRALNEAFPDTTKIIIAQRIASVKDADRIAVLGDGCIADCGTHAELLERSPIYQDIYRSQLKGGPTVA